METSPCFLLSVYLYLLCVDICVYLYPFLHDYAYLDFSHPQTSLKAIRYNLSNQVDNYEPLDINNNSEHCSISLITEPVYIVMLQG